MKHSATEPFMVRHTSKFQQKRRLVKDEALSQSTQEFTDKLMVALKKEYQK